MPPENRTGPLGEGAGSKSIVGDGGHGKNTRSTPPAVTGDAIDQVIADACAIRGCGCGCGCDPDVTVTRDGAIRRVTVAHDDWCAAIGGVA